MALRADDVDLGRDRALVESFQAGDVAAFEELYARYHDRLVRYCYRRLGDLHEAEEVAQEAFMRALRALPTFEGERRFYPWMTVIASRLCIDSYRRTSRVDPVDSIEGDAVDGGQDAIVDQVDLDHVRRALDRLHGRHREVLDLRERDLQSYQNIADTMGISMSAVETLLFRARRALRREFMALSGESLLALPLVGRLIRRLGALRNPFTADAAPTLGNVTMAVAMVAAVACGGVAASHHGTDALPGRPVMIASTSTTVISAAVAPAVTATTTATTAPATNPGTATKTAAPARPPSAPVPVHPRVMSYSQEQETAAGAPIYFAMEGVGNVSVNPSALAAPITSAITPRNER